VDGDYQDTFGQDMGQVPQDPETVYHDADTTVVTRPSERTGVLIFPTRWVSGMLAVEVGRSFSIFAGKDRLYLFFKCLT
jgi:hypothetical protein